MAFLQLETCTEYQERRKIRAAIRELQNFKTTTRHDGTQRISREGILERTGQQKQGHVRSYVDTKELKNGDKLTKDMERRPDIPSIRDAKRDKVFPRPSAVLSKPRDSDNTVSRSRTSGALGTSTSKLGNSKNASNWTTHSDQPMGLKSDMTSSRSTRLITSSRLGSRHSDTTVTRLSDVLKTHEMDHDTSNINRESNYTSSNNTSLSNNKTTVSRLENSQKNVTKISDPYVMKSEPIKTDPKVSRSSTLDLTSRRKTSLDVKSMNQKSDQVIIKRPSAVVRPFQSSTLNSFQSYSLFADSKNQDKISESDFESCFNRNNSSRRTLPISNKVESHPSIERKELRSNIRTSLPLVSLSSYSSPNFDYKPRPDRRVSFKDEAGLLSIEDPQAPKSDLKTLSVPGIPKVTGSDNYKDFTSEKELQNLLQDISDLNERKKIRFRIKEIREGQITGRSVEEPPVNPVEEKQGQLTCVDYDKIEDEEQLKQLLKDTGDVDEKRKIRNCIRQIRRRSELGMYRNIKTGFNITNRIF
ncbi:hypothetical protein LOTGIDRAFT_151881 [Lottia gigantea]|uniref:Smoothelin domain-containing protein n=1 Tax=Lottia gigantea TaxID=225164 RepID=V4B3U2_LOTGI|nr:hypothetical protein LOTGIDRAFT_151881 [Lottia gigantea]ESP05083.1 hypothetical protein LOTGIDRAFT_151881 [Lottia gigantea]